MAAARRGFYYGIGACFAIAIASTPLFAAPCLAADSSDPFVSFGEISAPVAPGSAGSPETNGNYRAEISLGSIGTGYLNSQGIGDEGFGSNVSFLPQVEKTAENLPFLRAPDGSATLFTQDGKPRDPRKNDERTLRPTSDGQGYVLTLPSGATTTFSQTVGAAFYPSALKDPVGNETRIAYVSASSPVPTSITGSDGSSLVTFKSSGSRITSIVDRYGLTTQLAYDANGRLLETKKPDGTTGTSITYASVSGLALPVTIADEGKTRSLVSYTVSTSTNTAYVKDIGAPSGEVDTYTYGSNFAETSGKTRPTVRTDYQAGYVSAVTLNGTRIQTLQRDTNGAILSLTDQTGTTRFNYGKGSVTANYPDGSKSETVRDDNNNLVSLSVTGGDGQTRTKSYTYSGRLLQNVTISTGGKVTSSQEYQYQGGAPSRITNRVATSITLDAQGRPSAAVLGSGSAVSITRSTGAVTTVVDGSSTTVRCSASADGGMTRDTSTKLGAVAFSSTAQTDASGLNSSWRTTFGDSITRGSRTGAITLNGSTSAESCEASSSQCQTTWSCVPNSFGECDVQESSTCANVTPSDTPAPPPTSTPVPGYCSTSGSNGCNPGYQPQIARGPGQSTYCTCVKGA